MTIDDALALPGEAVATTPTWSMATLSVRLLEVAAAGALAAVLMVLLWIQPRADLMAAFGTSFFWLKALYTTALAITALFALRALAHPAGSAWKALGVMGAVIAVMLTAGVVEAVQLQPAMLAWLFGPTNIVLCQLYVVSLATPMLLVAAIGLRQLHLERPLLKGAIIGLFSGAVAATIYGLHCAHASFLYVSLWYTCAVLLCGALGAGLVKAIRPRTPLAAE